jgi:hypothetical protein
MSGGRSWRTRAEVHRDEETGERAVLKPCRRGRQREKLKAII